MKISAIHYSGNIVSGKVLVLILHLHTVHRAELHAVNFGDILLRSEI